MFRLASSQISRIHFRKNLHVATVDYRDARTKNKKAKEVQVRTGIQEAELDFKAAAIAKWIEKDLQVTVLIRKRRRDTDTELMKSIMSYLQKKVKELTDDTATSKIKENKNSMLFERKQESS